MSGLISNDSAEIKEFINESNTVVLVISGAQNTQSQQLYNDAIEVIANNNPAVWRILWVKNPDGLDSDLTTLFWPSDLAGAVVMSLGTGLNRQIKAHFSTGELSGGLAIFETFSKG